jgi:hypothetical protein
MIGRLSSRRAIPQWGASFTSAGLCSALVVFRTNGSDAALKLYRAEPINRVVSGISWRITRTAKPHRGQRRSW